MTDQTSRSWFSRGRSCENNIKKKTRDSSLRDLSREQLLEEERMKKKGGGETSA